MNNPKPGSTMSNTVLKRMVQMMFAAIVVVVFVGVAMFTLPRQSTASGSNQLGNAVPAAALISDAQPQAQPTPNSQKEVVPPDYAPGGGFYPPVVDQGGDCISGYVIDVYHQNAGAGWEIVVTSKETGQVWTQITGVDGHYSFSPLPAGTYVVEIKYREGWRAFTLQSFEVTLSGEPGVCAVTRFKMEALPCLIVRKIDKNSAGLPNPVGLADWPITVRNGDYSETKLTDWDGYAEFRYLVPGTWIVEEANQIGWIPEVGQPSSITLSSPRQPYTCERIVLVNKQLHTSCIAAKKVDDQGRPLANWVINLVRKDGTRPPRQTVTDANGYAFFLDLELGEWIVSEVVQDGWQPVGETSYTVNLDVPTTLCPTVTFINQPTGCIEGLKINHYDQGLPNWRINATHTATGQQLSTITDINGYFKFENMLLGEWVIREEMQPGWEAVTPGELTVTLTDPFKCEQIRFKNMTEFACLDVYKYDDTGAPLPGWTMILEPAYGGEQLTGITDGSGWVRFNKLTPGEYYVTEIVQEGWDPITPIHQYVRVEATGTCRIMEFYNEQESPYCDDDCHDDCDDDCDDDCSIDGCCNDCNNGCCNGCNNGCCDGCNNGCCNGCNNGCCTNCNNGCCNGCCDSTYCTASSSEQIWNPPDPSNCCCCCCCGGLTGCTPDYCPTGCDQNCSAAACSSATDVSIIYPNNCCCCCCTPPYMPSLPSDGSSDGDSSGTTTYVVKSGDTLFAISQAYGITVNQLKAANGLTSSLIYTGQILKIP